MEDAAQGFGQRGFGIVDASGDLDRIHSRNGKIFCQATREAGNAMLAIEGALMRIPGGAVFTNRISVGAQAIESLVEDHPVAGSEALGQRPHLLYDAYYFVTQDLRLFAQRDYSTAFICIVV